MAIRPVDLQGAFAAATQNASIVRNAEEAPAVAQQAAQATFVKQLEDREETIEESQHATGNKVQPRGDKDPEHQARQQAEPDDGRHEYREAYAQTAPLGLAEDGQHFIDVSA